MRVIIADEPFGSGFDVTVVPPLPGVRLDREFETHGEALGYAEQVAYGRGWAIIDRSCGADA